MELNDVIEALKILSFVGTSANSEITMSLLHLIKYQINDVTLGKLVSGSRKINNERHFQFVTNNRSLLLPTQVT